MHGQNHIKSQPILVTNIKNSATIKVLAGQAQSINLYKNIRTKVKKCCANMYFNRHQYNFVNNMVSHNVHSLYVRYCVLYLAWWWLDEPKHVAEFLILITNECCVIWPSNYYFSIFLSPQLQ